MKRRTDTECYCDCFRVWEEQYREELILNVTVFVSGSGEGNIGRK